MKKILVLVLSMVLVISLAACGKKPSGNSDKPTGTTEKPTEKPTATPTEPVNDPGNNPVPEGGVTDPTKLGEAITYWVEGDYLYFKIKTSAEIDAHRYSIDIVNPGFYLTRDSENATQSIYEKPRAFAEEFDKEYFDGYYVFRVDSNAIAGIASDDSEWAPGTWSVRLFNEDTGILLGQWLIVLEGGGKYHFEFNTFSWLYGAGEDRAVKEFDSLQDEVASWFTFKADESDDDWAVFNFNGYYLEQIDSYGYDSYYLMVCPEGDYTTYEEANAVDFTYCGFGGLDYARCPYRFAFEQYGIEPGKYTIVLARDGRNDLGLGGNVEVQFTAEKKGPKDWVMDFSNVKCPALNGKYGIAVAPVTPDGDPAEYSREYWEAKYPGENVCPFGIEENGKEYSYYWVSGLEGWDGTMASWVKQPFNWNGWHMTEDGCIVNKDETLKIADSWAKGEETMSSFCTVTTEKYEKDVTQGSESVSAVLASVGLSEADIQTSLGFTLGEPTESDAQYYVSVAYDSSDSFKKWVEAIAENCRKAAKDGNIYESEFATEALTEFELDDSAVINMVQFIYRTSGKVVYVTLSSSGADLDSFSCNIQIY